MAAQQRTSRQSRRRRVAMGHGRAAAGGRPRWSNGGRRVRSPTGRANRQNRCGWTAPSWASGSSLGTGGQSAFRPWGTAGRGTHETRATASARSARHLRSGRRGCRNESETRRGSAIPDDCRHLLRCRLPMIGRVACRSNRGRQVSMKTRATWRVTVSHEARRRRMRRGASGAPLGAGGLTGTCANIGSARGSVTYRAWTPGWPSSCVLMGTAMTRWQTVARGGLGHTSAELPVVE